MMQAMTILALQLRRLEEKEGATPSGVSDSFVCPRAGSKARQPWALQMEPLWGSRNPFGILEGLREDVGKSSGRIKVDLREERRRPGVAPFVCPIQSGGKPHALQNERRSLGGGCVIALRR